MPRPCAVPLHSVFGYLRRGAIRAALGLALALSAFTSLLAQTQTQTLKAVQARGTLACGVNRSLPGFAALDTHGKWSGFDVDFCHAVAAAVLGDPAKVRFVPLDVPNRFTALQNGAVDVLSRNSTWTLSREAELSLLFPVVTYYDGQGFLARGERGMLKPEHLAGGRICVQTGTTHDSYASDYFESRGLKVDVVAFATPATLVKAYQSDWCDAITSDVSQLYALRRIMAAPSQQAIADVVISKEPLGPVVRQGDDQWFSIVRWTHFAMVRAEALGISSATLAAASPPKSAEAERLLSEQSDPFAALGLAPGAFARIVRGVGNYGEVYDRNLGAGSGLGIPRGLNRLARDGGLQYAPAFR